MGRKPSKRLRSASDSETWRTGVKTAVILAITVALALVLSLGHPSGLTSTLVLLLVGGGTLATLYLTWVMYRDSRRGDSAISPSTLADQLAIAIGRHWEAEARLRRLNDPYPLDVSWSAADQALTDSWELVERLARSGAGWPEPPPAGTWAAGPDDLAGEGDALARLLMRIPTRRLVVLGAPGTGKTILMIRLVLDLLKDRQPGGPVPFLVPLASWNPSVEDLRSWLAAQLVTDHPTLGAPNPAGDGSCAEVLLASGLITPILDGLDEIPQEIRGSAISSINDALMPGGPVVVTCRAEEYRDTVRPPDAREVTLRAATAIELNPLTVDKVADYLLSDAGGPEAKERWQPVIRAMKKDTPVAQALITPLMTGLARVIYNPRPGEAIGNLRDPSELTSADLGNRAAVETHLFDAFVTAAYRLAARWPARKVEAAFAFLAHHLEETIGNPDFAWWQLRYSVSPPGRNRASTVIAYTCWALSIVLIFLLPFFALYVPLGFTIALGIVGGFVSGLIGVIGVLLTTKGVDPSPRVRLLRSPRSRGIAAVGVIAIFISVPVLWFMAGSRPALILALGLTLAIASTVAVTLEGVEGDLTAAPSPRAVLDRDQRASFMVAATVLLAAILTIGVIAVFSSGLVFSYGTRIPYLFWAVGSLAFGLTMALTFSANETAWPAYTITRIWLTMHQRLPWALMDFLDDAHERGVLRQAGAIYQFRHIELQRRLAARYQELTEKPPARG